MKKILVLENGRAVYKMIRRMFNNEEYKAYMPGKNPEELFRLPVMMPDLVLADLTSVKTRNVELLLQLRSHPITALVPFLLITSGKIEVNKDIYSGIKYHLSKPYTENDLSLLIRNIFYTIDNSDPW